MHEHKEPITRGEFEPFLDRYDIAFVAGFDNTMTLEDIVVRTYGELMMTRSGSIKAYLGGANLPIANAQINPEKAG